MLAPGGYLWAVRVEYGPLEHPFPRCFAKCGFYLGVLFFFQPKIRNIGHVTSGGV